MTYMIHDWWLCTSVQCYIINPSPAECYPISANSVDPDQLASEEANWSGSALFVNKNDNLYQQPVSSNLIGWKLELGVVS